MARAPINCRASAAADAELEMKFRGNAQNSLSVQIRVYPWLNLFAPAQCYITTAVVIRVICLRSSDRRQDLRS